MRDKEKLKKLIKYRSTHRGIKEMDLLLGNFVKKNINLFNLKELLDLYNLIQIDDEILKNWFVNNKNHGSIPINKVSKMMKKFKL